MRKAKIAAMIVFIFQPPYDLDARGKAATSGGPSSRFYAGFNANGWSRVHSHRLRIGIEQLRHPACLGQ
jgi:hypothetical protein